MPLVVKNRYFSASLLSISIYSVLSSSDHSLKKQLQQPLWKTNSANILLKFALKIKNKSQSLEAVRLTFLKWQLGDLVIWA